MESDNSYLAGSSRGDDSYMRSFEYDDDYSYHTIGTDMSLDDYECANKPATGERRRRLVESWARQCWSSTRTQIRDTTYDLLRRLLIPKGMEPLPASRSAADLPLPLELPTSEFRTAELDSIGLSSYRDLNEPATAGSCAYEMMENPARFGRPLPEAYTWVGYGGIGGPIAPAAPAAVPAPVDHTEACGTFQLPYRGLTDLYDKYIMPAAGKASRVCSADFGGVFERDGGPEMWKMV
ncbi:uncharacterized protein V1510DRAFT_412597 [Dipodascopsis tothii]|uniref:uncharacterized protein n=1 Tax=Dipodascopsis tothii TaxID=44089 RepID=UPI0034CF62C4